MKHEIKRSTCYHIYISIFLHYEKKRNGKKIGVGTSVLSTFYLFECNFIHLVSAELILLGIVFGKIIID